MKLHGSSILEQKQIYSLLGPSLNWLRFPTALEKDYQCQYQREAAHEYRFKGPFIFFLYLLLSYGIYQLLAPEHLAVWLKLYSSVGAIVFVAWTFTFFEKLHKWFEYYAAIGGSLAIAISIVIVTFFDGGEVSILLHAAILYAVIIIYGFAGLGFYTAVITGWLGGILGLALSYYFSGEIGWTVLNRTYTFSSFLGMALAYATDRQHRENYLQSCLLELNRLEMISHNNQLEVLSRQDALTGIANRRYLDEMLQDEWFRAMRHQTPLTIMMIDVDFFKAYNDALGHIAGDHCLVQIADTITKIAARSGEIVARYGGEEFLMLLPMTDQQQASRQAQRLLQSISDLKIPHPASEISPFVTLSIGVATYTPQLHEQIRDFLHLADNALYKAKTMGRNNYKTAEIKPHSLSNTLAS